MSQKKAASFGPFQHPLQAIRSCVNNHPDRLTWDSIVHAVAGEPLDPRFGTPEFWFLQSTLAKIAAHCSVVAYEVRPGAWFARVATAGPLVEILLGKAVTMNIENFEALAIDFPEHIDAMKASESPEALVLVVGTHRALHESDPRAYEAHCARYGITPYVAQERHTSARLRMRHPDRPFVILHGQLFANADLVHGVKVDPRIIGDELLRAEESINDRFAVVIRVAESAVRPLPDATYQGLIDNFVRTYVLRSLVLGTAV